MRIDSTNDIGHAGQDHDIALAGRGLDVGQDERLGLHAARVADPGEWVGRQRDNGLKRHATGDDAFLGQDGFVAVPAAARTIRGAGQPRLHLLTEGRDGGEENSQGSKHSSHSKTP
ncbi:hypothetical protein [Tunturiibacter lichenicola]|uniref:hypothetical protein n=1 Tax=Tunturiibacter lichenicola TaxID=2051959 RepID=UPI003D9ABD79